jgi:hypothetical protein
MAQVVDNLPDNGKALSPNLNSTLLFLISTITSYSTLVVYCFFLSFLFNVGN